MKSRQINKETPQKIDRGRYRPLPQITRVLISRRPYYLRTWHRLGYLACVPEICTPKVFVIFCTMQQVAKYLLRACSRVKQMYRLQVADEHKPLSVWDPLPLDNQVVRMKTSDAFKTCLKVITIIIE